MSLHLDARQRAMLQEMGVTVWGPPPAAAPTAPPAAPSAAVSAAAVEARSPAAAPAHAPAPPPVAAAPRSAAPLPTAAPRTPPPSTSSVAPPSTGPAAPALQLHAPQALYPTADPAQTPAGLGSGWLIVAESLTPADPLGGDAGRLLDNMLRAMQLHRHPRVFLAALERPGPGAEASAHIPATLADVVATLQPAMVLVLGHVAARAALGRTEPLGRLRAGPHQLAGCPAVVTYDPAFLLRSQDTKAAAWADLCRALALVRGA
ncbi:uracil-DNA glycosylase family protein [Acidovorax sp. FJL06]|uniref:uracil-DNA glycosylase family protein n=1 Tax=Acidovorax sp. FJL06 TaxID=2153365 RepID=UPI0018F5387B|nr:uracil-DNA glycosylase family protein [Acidovorax sp. FJL06]